MLRTNGTGTRTQEGAASSLTLAEHNHRACNSPMNSLAREPRTPFGNEPQLYAIADKRLESRPEISSERRPAVAGRSVLTEAKGQRQPRKMMSAGTRGTGCREAPGRSGPALGVGEDFFGGLCECVCRSGPAGLTWRKENSRVFLGGALRCLADSEAPPQKKKRKEN
jgi:hypothetical protein